MPCRAVSERLRHGQEKQQSARDRWSPVNPVWDVSVSASVTRPPAAADGTVDSRGGGAGPGAEDTRGAG